MPQQAYSNPGPRVVRPRQPGPETSVRMHEQWRRRIREIEDDSTSGATAILTRALDILRDAANEPRESVAALADALCDAQPSMAGLLTAARVVKTSADVPSALDRLMHQVARAPELIARHAAALLLLRPEGNPLQESAPLRLVTCSSSSAVEATIRLVSRQSSAVVSCTESRPKLEGRAMAVRLANAGVAVELYTDAGISAAVPLADALIVGADALGPSAFVNKVGTRALCALAGSAGVPVYVLAGREKVLDELDFARLSLKEADSVEVWAGKEPLVGRNPIFERVPVELVSTIITDGGRMI